MQEGEEIMFVKEIITKNMIESNLKVNFQDLRIVKHQEVESILFQVPHPLEFTEKETFKKKCSAGINEKYPDCQIIIEFKSQMTTR